MGGGEAGFVDAVVDVIVCPIVYSFDVFLQVGGEKVEFGVLFRENVVEFVIEHADDVGRFIRHDGFGLLVIECGYRETTAVVWVDVEVDIAKMSEGGMDGIWADVLAR